MSSSSRSQGNHCCSGWGKNGNWSGFNIGAMVLGFVFFWPVGLVILYWISKGRKVETLPQGIRDQWAKMKGGWSGKGCCGSTRRHDNDLFNQFQQTQYDRIVEIKEEIKERSQRFSAFRDDVKRRADEEEFNRFMADAPGHSEA